MHQVSCLFCDSASRRRRVERPVRIASRSSLVARRSASSSGPCRCDTRCCSIYAFTALVMTMHVTRRSAGCTWRDTIPRRSRRSTMPETVLCASPMRSLSSLRVNPSDVPDCSAWNRAIIACICGGVSCALRWSSSITRIISRRMVRNCCSISATSRSNSSSVFAASCIACADAGKPCSCSAISPHLLRYLCSPFPPSESRDQLWHTTFILDILFAKNLREQAFFLMQLDFQEDDAEEKEGGIAAQAAHEHRAQEHTQHTRIDGMSCNAIGAIGVQLVTGPRYCRK